MSTTGKRYTNEEKKEILQFRETHTYQETSEKYGISQMTLARWSQRLRKNEYEKKTEVIKMEMKIRYGENLNADLKAKAPELTTTLEVLKFLKGIKLIALVNDDGQLLTMLSKKTGDFPEPNEIVMNTIAALSLAGRASGQLKMGTLETMVMKSNHGFLLINAAGPQLVLTLLFDEEADLKHLFQEDFAVIGRVAQLLAEKYA
jgi:predicted regulator of Ras-like GTPase activity (Roadblock/LC7/MglB family)